MIRPICFVGASAHAQRTSSTLACRLRAPPRSWTLLIRLPGRKGRRCESLSVFCCCSLWSLRRRLDRSTRRGRRRRSFAARATASPGRVGSNTMPILAGIAPWYFKSDPDYSAQRPSREWSPTRRWCCRSASTTSRRTSRSGAHAIARRARSRRGRARASRGRPVHALPRRLGQGGSIQRCPISRPAARVSPQQMLLFKADRRSPATRHLKALKTLMRTIPTSRSPISRPTGRASGKWHSPMGPFSSGSARHRRLRNLIGAGGGFLLYPSWFWAITSTGAGRRHLAVPRVPQRGLRQRGLPSAAPRRSLLGWKFAAATIPGAIIGRLPHALDLVVGLQPALRHRAVAIAVLLFSGIAMAPSRRARGPPGRGRLQ